MKINEQLLLDRIKEHLSPDARAALPKVSGHYLAIAKQCLSERAPLALHEDSTWHGRRVEIDIPTVREEQ